MSKIQSEAEEKFYEGIGYVSKKEQTEMTKLKTDPIKLKVLSINRDDRLSKLLKAYEREIRDKLFSLPVLDKIDFLDSHLQEAKKYKKQWTSDYKKYSNNHRLPNWNISSTNQNLSFICRLIKTLEKYKENVVSNRKNKLYEISGKSDDTSQLPGSMKKKVFKLMANVDTESCYNVLKGELIDVSITKKIFNSLFKDKECDQKISWIGTLNELSRFIFLLHNDVQKDDNIMVCEKQSHIWNISCNLFLHNGKPVTSSQLKENNRDIKDPIRKVQLLRAVKHLRKPGPTTQK